MAFGFETEDILESQIPGQRKLARILEHVVQQPGFDAGSMLPGDAYAIIAVARALTYGEHYRFKVTCPICAHPEVISIKVPDELPIQDWEEFPDEASLRAASVITLPVSGDRVAIRFPSLNDEIANEEKRRAAKAASGSEQSAKLYQTALRIDSVNGGTVGDLVEALTYVRSIRGRDMISLIQFIDSLDPGVNLSYSVACDKCGEKFDARIPISADFFRENRV